MDHFVKIFYTTFLLHIFYVSIHKCLPLCCRCLQHSVVTAAGRRGLHLGQCKCSLWRSRQGGCLNHTRLRHSPIVKQRGTILRNLSMVLDVMVTTTKLTRDPFYPTQIPAYYRLQDLRIFLLHKTMLNDIIGFQVQRTKSTLASWTEAGWSPVLDAFQHCWEGWGL